MIPIKLRLLNFLAHCDSVLDFESLDPIVLITGAINGDPSKSNGAGKTSIYEAITYALYDATRIDTDYRSEISKNKLIRSNEKQMEVTFDFKIDDVLYRVVRGRDRQKNKTELTLSRFNGKKWIPEGDSKIRSTNQKIIQLVGMDYEVFRNSVFFRQHEVSTFAKISSSERKNIVRSILQLDRYDRYEKYAGKQLSELDRALGEKNVFLEEHKNVDQKIEDSKKQIEGIQTHLKIEEQKLSGLQKKEDKLRTEQGALNKSVIDKEILEEAIEKLEQGLATTTSELEQALLRKESCEEQFNEKKIQYEHLYEQAQLLEQDNAEEVNTLKNKHNIYKLQIDRTETEYRKVQSKVFIVDQKLEEIDNQILEIENYNEDSCPFCTQPLTKAHKKVVLTELRETRKLWAERQEKGKEMLDDALNKAQKTRTEFTNLEQQIDKIKAEAEKAGRLKLKLKGVKETASALKDGVSNAEMLSKQQEKRLGQLQDEYDKKKQQLTDFASIDIERFVGINTELKQLQISREIATNSIRELEIKRGVQKERLSQQEKISEQVEQTKQEMQKSLQERQILKELTKAFGKNGIQALILENSAAEIEEISNSLLARLTNSNLSIRIRTQKKNQDGTYKEVFDVIITDQYHTSPFELYSGGEAFRISFVIRIALSTLLARRFGVQISALFYDEAFQDLDSDGTAGLIDAFHLLSKDFRYQLVITHDSELKSRFDSVVTIVKDDNGAIIKY